MKMIIKKKLIIITTTTMIIIVKLRREEMKLLRESVGEIQERCQYMVGYTIIFYCIHV